MSAAHWILAALLAVYVGTIYVKWPDRQTSPPPVCEQPHETAYLKDCLFQADGMCRFLWIYEYQDKAIADPDRLGIESEY